MSLDLFESVVKQIADGRGTFVDPNFSLLFTAHYNEVLLYDNFEKMLEILGKYKMSTVIFTNGVPLTKENVDIMKRHHYAIATILLNIPSYEKESWSMMTGFNKNVFDKLLGNLDYLFEKMDKQAKRGLVQLVVNSLDTNSLPESGGTVQPLERMPKIDLSLDTGHLAKTKEFYENRYPLMKVSTNNYLIDRAGYLAREKVMTNLPTVLNHNKGSKTKVIGCMDSFSRTDSWIHINANGDVFLCCDDYDFETVYSNIADKSLEEIWNSSERKEAIKKAQSTLCTNCIHAIWGD